MCVGHLVTYVPACAASRAVRTWLSTNTVYGSCVLKSYVTYRASLCDTPETLLHGGDTGHCAALEVERTPPAPRVSRTPNTARLLVAPRRSSQHAPA